MVEKKKAVPTDPTDEIYARLRLAFPKSWNFMKPFLDDYEKTESITISSKNVGISRDTVAVWKHNDDFLGLFTKSHISAANRNNDNLKTSALARAINGNPHYLIDRKTGSVMRDINNQPIVQFRDYETQLTMFMLKNRMPEEFKDKFEHEINGQLVITLASEFLAIVRRHATPQISDAIQKDLETLSAKLSQS